MTRCGEFSELHAEDAQPDSRMLHRFVESCLGLVRIARYPSVLGDPFEQGLESFVVGRKGRREFSRTPC
jgi:hypothetical protein